MNLDLHTSVIDVDVVHQVSNEAIKLLLPRDLKIQQRECQAQFNQTQAYPITRCFPLKSRIKHGAISFTRAFVILSMVFRMILSISGEIFSMYHREEPEKPL